MLRSRLTGQEQLANTGKPAPLVGSWPRASNGCTYMSFSDTNYPGPGGIFDVEINDLPNSRHIFLHPGLSNHNTYGVMVPPDGHFRTFSLQKNAAMLQQLQSSILQKPDRTRPDGQVHLTPLGTKQQDGITLFGQKSEVTSNSGDKRTEEMWHSDLGIVVISKTVWSSEDKESVVTVTDIHRTEPDPKLFEIPEGYQETSVAPAQLKSR
jgi:hypothetical protein